MVTFRTFWDKIPPPVRTIINVAFSAAIVTIAAAVLNANGVTNINWPSTLVIALNIFSISVCTAIVRALNPLDIVYGIGSKSSERK